MEQSFGSFRDTQTIDEEESDGSDDDAGNTNERERVSSQENAMEDEVNDTDDLSKYELDKYDEDDGECSIV